MTWHQYERSPEPWLIRIGAKTERDDDDDDDDNGKGLFLRHSI